MTDVCLVLTPYASLQRPALGLSLLKARLEQSGIHTSLLYSSFQFADEIGLPLYAVLASSQPAELWGEWTFSGAAFPQFRSDESEFLKIATANSDQVSPSSSVKWTKILQGTRRQAGPFIERLARSVLDLHPRIVGCSSTFQQHCSALALLRRIQELDPRVITLLGGANCEGQMGVTTRKAFPWVDFVCSGEADELMAEFCRKLLEQGRDLAPEELPYGIIGANHLDGHIPRASVRDLDRSPLPDYSDDFCALKSSRIAAYIHPALPIETSRGCWWGEMKHCTFCGLNGKGMAYRSKASRRVEEEFAELSHRYQIRKFFATDNILDMSHIDSVLPALAAVEEPYSIFYETKANLTRAQVQKLARAGIRAIQPGIESLNDLALKLLDKGNTTLINIQLLKWAREFGVRLTWNFMFNIPGESREWYPQLLDWLPLIVHLEPPGGSGPIRFDRFSPYHERQADYGLDLRPRKQYSYLYPLSPEEIEGLAYYFDDSASLNGQPVQAEDEQVPVAATPQLCPEHQALRDWFIQWNELFQYDAPPLLRLTDDDGESARVTDERPCRVRSTTSLEDLSYCVYMVCEQAATTRALLKRLRQTFHRDLVWGEVQPTVENLQEGKLLLEHRGQYLSLAVRAPVPPLLEQKEVPTGYSDLKGYIRHRQTQWPPLA